MKRTIMISDIHGCVEPFNRLLDKLEFDGRFDQLLLLGDYVDRGPNSKETVARVMELMREGSVIALRGNHDQRFVDVIRSDDESVQFKFAEHGGLPTLQSYCDFTIEEVNHTSILRAKEYILEHFPEHIAFLSGLPLYHEDQQHIYVHAGLNPAYSDWKEQPERDFMYIKGDFIRHPTVVSKKVIFGHTQVMDIHGSADVWYGGDKIGIDGGCAFGNQLNALIFQDEAYSTCEVK